MSTDAQMIMEWQKTKDPALFVQLSSRFKPVIEGTINQYRNTGVSPSTLRAGAQTQFLKAISSYKVGMGSEPITHLYNNMKKIQRTAGESLMSGHTPEVRNMKKATFAAGVTNLADRLGYEPNLQQICEELKWDKKEAARMLSEMSGETTASGAGFDFYGNSTQGESRDKALADYMYIELGDQDKVIFEHTFGYGGKPLLNNKEIAKKLGVNDMWVTRRKQSMAEKMKSYR